jgi:putative (di)nucleoside polyphosphate hydrolase
MYRKGVGLMLLNKEGHVFVAKRADAHKTKLNTWQMPQGGIEEGEEEIEALYRESFEEISLQKDEFTILTKTKELLRYDIPAEVSTPWDKAQYKGQEQRWFLGLLKDNNYNFNLNTAEPEFTSWKWVSHLTLASLAVSFKKEIYKDILDEFIPLINEIKNRIPRN